MDFPGRGTISIWPALVAAATAGTTGAVVDRAGGP
jgi:hypothetical protein